MKIKKMTVTMLVVAALAAIIGVSAVSYAAWTSGNNSFEASASTGTVSLVGFTGDTADIAFDPVVPYDQKGDIKTGAVIQSVILPDFVVTSDYTITVTSDTSLTFYVKVAGADETVNAPADAAAIVSDGWTAVSVDGTAIDRVKGANDADKEYTTVSGDKLYLILDSSDNDQMNRTGITLTVTLDLKTA